MERVHVQSSNIASVGYDDQDGILEVEFDNGTIYEYYQVPEGVFRALITASSPGQFLAAQVKDVYRYRRVA